MKKNNMKISLLTLALASASELAYAQLEEVIVTAQRKSESLQEVPISISALSQESIEKTDTHDLSTLAVQVPGLTFAPFAPGQNIIALRGASSNDDGAGTDSSIAVFIDDVYLGRASNINPELFDLERIEVLRGPQGTLYGKNTIGGAINIISTTPNTENFEAKFKVSAGNFGQLNLGGLVSGPLSDTWAAKLAVSSRTRDGFGDNKVLGKEQRDNDTQTLRAQFLYSGERLRALFTVDANQLDVEDTGRVPVASNYNNNVGGANPAVFRAPYEAVCGNVEGADCLAGLVDGYAKQEAHGISARLSWDIGDNSELISITAFRNSENDWNMDSTGSPALALNDDIFDETDQISQEFRWVSAPRDNFNYVLGFWLLNEKTDRSECFDLSVGSDCTVVINGVNDGSDYYRQENETESVAAFGQFDWSFADDWTLTVGGRFSYEEKSIDNTSLAGNFVVINDTFSNSRSVSFDSFTPKVSLNYAVNDSTNVYASFAKGFKSGGFPAAPFLIEDTEPLDQETAESFEIGVKSDISDNLRINSSIFYTEYDGLQIQSFGVRPDCPMTVPASPCSFGGFQTFNAGDNAKILGFETEATWLVTDNLTLSGSLGLVESEFGETNISNSVYANQDGQDLLRTPELKYAVNADYVMPLDSGAEMSFNLNYSFTDDQRGELEPYAIQPEFSLLNARAAWGSADDKYELVLWGKNLADETYISHIYTIASSVTAVYGDPRTYGVSMTYKY